MKLTMNIQAEIPWGLLPKGAEGQRVPMMPQGIFYLESIMKTTEERFEANYIPEPNSGCWLWIGAIRKCGYGYMEYFGKPMGAHRIAWEIYRGEIPKHLFVLHKCDTPRCVNPVHLFLGNQKDNMQDCFKKGRFDNCRGENNKNAKLTAAEVETIRLMLMLGFRQNVIAKRYGVDPRLINKISMGRTWKN